MAPAFRLKGLSAGLLLSAALALAACDRYADDIAAVKQAQVLGDSTGEKLCTDIAGVRGSFEWEAGRSEAYKDNPDIVQVTCKVTRQTSSGAVRHVDLEFIHNRQTRKVALDRVLIDGQEQSIVSGMLNLLLMQLQ
ncbi:MAG: hypothetical protein ACOY3L_05180 [Pseudomonadota bacterium]